MCITGQAVCMDVQRSEISPSTLHCSSHKTWVYEGMNIGRLPNYRASQTRCNQYSSTATPDPMTTPLRPSTPTISNRIPELDPFPLESVPFPDVKFPLSDALVPVLALIPAVIDPFFNDPEVVLEYRERVIRNLQWNLLNSKSWSKYLLHSTSARYDHTQSRHT